MRVPDLEKLISRWETPYYGSLLENLARIEGVLHELYMSGGAFGDLHYGYDVFNRVQDHIMLYHATDVSPTVKTLIYSMGQDYDAYRDWLSSDERTVPNYRDPVCIEHIEEAIYTLRLECHLGYQHVADYPQSPL